jgi:hypothetical protein
MLVFHIHNSILIFPKDKTLQNSKQLLVKYKYHATIDMENISHFQKDLQNTKYNYHRNIYIKKKNYASRRKKVSLIQGQEKMQHLGH